MIEQKTFSISKLKQKIASNPDFLIFSCIASIVSAFVFPLIPEQYLKTGLKWLWIFIFLASIIFALAKIKVIQKSKMLIIYLFFYFIFTYLLWMLVYNNDWNLYRLTMNHLQKPELSHDVVLVSINYPDRITFRENVGFFLQKLAELPEKPLVVGLDIIYKKFEQNTRKTRYATSNLTKGVQSLKNQNISVIAGYDPRKAKDEYDKTLFDETTPFTDIGHNLIHVRDGKLYAKIFETIISDLQMGLEQKIFFAVLVVKYANNFKNDYPILLEKQYHNIFPIRYQKDFRFKKYHFANKKEFDKISPDTFANKIVLVGNFKKDYKPEEGFFGLHAIGYAVQMLTDQAKGKEILIKLEYREWIILGVALCFSLLEIFLFYLIFNRLKKLKLVLIISSTASMILFFSLVAFLLQFNYLFADFTIVLSSIMVSGSLFAYYWGTTQNRLHANHPPELED